MAKQTKAEKMRVALAKDVQLQLKSRSFQVVTGRYVGGDAYDAARDLEAKKPGGDVRKFIGKKLKKCLVCAKGALFIAHILRNDRIKVGEFIDLADGELSDNNPTDFTDKQWAEIEILFEGASIVQGVILRHDTVEFLVQYSTRLLSDNAKERLHQIMQLIIDSNGKRVLLPYPER